MYRRLVLALLGLMLASCGGGGGGLSPGPTAVPRPSVAFEPSTISVDAASYDFFGIFAFTASTNGVPKPIDPADGTLACNGGYHVQLQIRAGPDQLGVVRDQYVVLPLLASPPAGSKLTCAGTWGIFDASGALLGSATLNATIDYNQTGTIIGFSPTPATVHAAGGDPPIELAYTSAAGFSIEALDPANGTLACPNGYAPQTQLSAGPNTPGAIEDRLTVVTSSIAPPAGTKLQCFVTYGLLNPAKLLVAEATLTLTLLY
jgi:hypothetical protein